MHGKFRKLGVLVVALVLMMCYLAASNGLSSAEAKPTLSVSLYKDNGYSTGSDINGFFTVQTEVSADVTRVEFYLDNQLQANVTASPFSWPFNTNNYTLGLHTIKVVAYNAAGEEASVEIQRNFVEFPILFVVVIIVVVVVSLIVGIFLARRREAQEKQDAMRRRQN
jgi:heme/copper-type cytochrome/quinol oxidase subunit 2